ncbi:MAG: hypothetical protein QI223_04010, partial [Candidatus Korarchaeota archaeon]|nr:hypothetical protein [Candidatus Korarchaeota archaeon]
MCALSDSGRPGSPEGGGKGQGVRVLISVVGLPHQLRWAYYRVMGGKRARSRLATAPLLAELLKDVEPQDVRLVLLAPHSLIPVCDNWRELLSAGDLRSLTEGIARGAAEFVLESLSRVAEDLGEGDVVAERLRRLLEDSPDGEPGWLRVAVVQVRGSFPLGGPREGPVLEFDGDPTHAFVEVYRILKEIHRDRRISGICVDLSHGWNFLSVLAYLGAAAFRDAYLPDLRLEVKSSEPYTALASPSVQGKGSDRGGNRRRLPSGEGEGKYALGLIDVEPAADTLRLVRDAAAVRAIPHRSLSFEAMLSAYEAATEELGLLPEAARCLVKSAALLRKVSCGLHLGIIPYLHWSLTLLGDSLPYLRRVVDEVEGLFGGSVYLEANLAEGRVSYRKKPPLTYVLLDVLVRLLEELWNELSAYLK